MILSHLPLFDFPAHYAVQNQNWSRAFCPYIITKRAIQSPAIYHNQNPFQRLQLLCQGGRLALQETPRWGFEALSKVHRTFRELSETLRTLNVSIAHSYPGRFNPPSG